MKRPPPPRVERQHHPSEKAIERRQRPVEQYLSLAVGRCGASEGLATVMVFACSVVGDGVGELWLAADFVSPAVILLVWRGAPAVTMVELRYAVNRVAKAARP
jgi:hypothetical protein